MDDKQITSRLEDDDPHREYSPLCEENAASQLPQAQDQKPAMNVSTARSFEHPKQDHSAVEAILVSDDEQVPLLPQLQPVQAQDRVSAIQTQATELGPTDQRGSTPSEAIIISDDGQMILSPAPRPSCQLKERLRYLRRDLRRISAHSPLGKWLASFQKAPYKHQKAYSQQYWPSDEKAWEDLNWVAGWSENFELARMNRMTWEAFKKKQPDIDFDEYLKKETEKLREKMKIFPPPEPETKEKGGSSMLMNIDVTGNQTSEKKMKRKRSTKPMDRHVEAETDESMKKAKVSSAVSTQSPSQSPVSSLSKDILEPDGKEEKGTRKMTGGIKKRVKKEHNRGRTGARSPSHSPAPQLADQTPVPTVEGGGDIGDFEAALLVEIERQHNHSTEPSNM